MATAQRLVVAAAAALTPARLRAGVAPQQRRTLAAGAVRGSSASTGGVRLDDAYGALQGCQLYIASSGERVSVTSLWGEQERALLVFGRSMG